MHHFDHVLDLVDMFVNESVMQETMAVVKPSAVLYSNIIVEECLRMILVLPYQASWERMQTKM